MTRVAYQVIHRKKMADGSIKEYTQTKYYNRKDEGEPRKPRPEKMKPAQEVIEQVRADIAAGLKTKAIMEKNQLTYYQVRKVATGKW